MLPQTNGRWKKKRRRTDGRPWDGRLFTTLDKTEIPLFAFESSFSFHGVLLLLQGVGGRQHMGTGAGAGGAYSGGFFTLFFRARSVMCDESRHTKLSFSCLAFVTIITLA